MANSQIDYPSDDVLIERIQNGNDAAIVLLIEKYEALLQAIIRDEVVDVDAREDVFAETCRAILVRLRKNATDIQALDKWLKQVARSKCQEHWRNVKKHLEIIALVGDLRDPARNQERPWESLYSEVFEIIYKMGPKYVKVVELWGQGWTSAEIGEQLGIPEGTVKSRQNTIRQKLRAHFGVSRPTKKQKQ